MIRFIIVSYACILVLFSATAFADGIKRTGDDNLILWLDFEAEDMKDSSPKNTAFTAFVPGKIVEGVVGNAWQFEEGTEIGVGTAFKDPFTENTFSIWVLKSSDSGVLYEEGGGTNGFCVQIQDRTLQYCTRDNGAAVCLQEDFPTGDDEWHLVTAVFDGSMKLYVDGELLADQNDVPGIGNHANESGIGRVGAGIHGTACNSDAGQWTGIMDELIVTRRAVSEQEIKSEFESGGIFAVAPTNKITGVWGKIKADLNI
jgi:hypothetical protein